MPAWMRPAMSDSLISGQPLNLLYWNWNFFAPAGTDRLLILLATHATGSVRLQVTGKPPTTNASAFVFAQPNMPRGSVAAASPCNASRRDTVSGVIDLVPRRIVRACP